MKRADLTITKDGRRSLQKQGFVRFRADQLITNPVFDAEFLKLRRAAASLPIDHTDQAAGRSRQYGRLVHLPWTGEEYPVPPRRYEHSGEFGLEYTQPASVNSEGGGVRRIFASLPPALYRNLALRSFISTFRAMLPLPSDIRAEASQIGVHLIKLEAAAGQFAKATPNLVHRDGEPFTAAVLLDRLGASGGENVITRPKWHDHPIEDVSPEDILARFTLEQPGDSYIVQDDAVAHYVGPVGCEPAVGRGIRTVLLLDYTPLRPAIVMTGMEPPLAA